MEQSLKFKLALTVLSRKDRINGSIMFSIPGDMLGHELHPILQKHHIAPMRRLRIPILALILPRHSLCQTLIRFLEPTLCVGNVCILKSMKIIISNCLLVLHLGHYRTVGLEIVYSPVLL